MTTLSHLSYHGERIKFNIQHSEKYDPKYVMKPLVSKFMCISRYVTLPRDDISTKTFSYES